MVNYERAVPVCGADQAGQPVTPAGFSRMATSHTAWLTCGCSMRMKFRVTLAASCSRDFHGHSCFSVDAGSFRVVWFSEPAGRAAVYLPAWTLYDPSGSIAGRVHQRTYRSWGARPLKRVSIGVAFACYAAGLRAGVVGKPDRQHVRCGFDHRSVPAKAHERDTAAD